MPALKNLTGQVFGRLTATERCGTSNDGKVMWSCRCECGVAHRARASDLLAGKTVSCGCYHAAEMTARNHKHGLAGTRTYQIWGSLIQRCTNQKNKKFADYGGRGINVCDEWRDFTYFVRDMGEAPAGMSIERDNNDKGYAPENCRWATLKEQANNKRSNVLIDVGGTTYTAAEAERATGIPAAKLRDRVRKGVVGGRVSIDGDLRTVAYRLDAGHKLVKVQP